MTIRKRLTLWYAALLTVIIILFGAITFGVMRFTMLNNIDTTLRETGQLIAVNSDQLLVPGFGAPTEVRIRLPSLDRFRAANIYVQAWEIDPQGNTELAESSANLRDMQTALDASALGREEDYINNTTLQGVNLRVLTKPITADGRLVGNLQVAVDLGTINQATDLLLLVMLISCGVAIVGAGALSLWFSDRALKPIEGITQAAASIAGTNDLSTRLDWDGPPDELGRLTSVFNHMMGRIEHLFSVQQRFVADISHELRTPLTSIQGNVEMVRRYGMDEESMAAIESESHRMSRLVNDLLMLARADYGGMTIDLYPLDLDSVMMEVFESAKVLADDRKLDVRMMQFEPVRINGNADRLKQMMLNLINNAIKFTEDGGYIGFSLETVGRRAVITVEDSGIGIAEEDIDRIFDRFYQSNPARTHTGDGFGLGLSIAKWIVDAHNGHIKAISKPGEGTRFVISIPIYNTQGKHHHEPDTDSKPTRPGISVISRSQSDQHKHHQHKTHETHTNGRDTHHQRSNN